MDMESGNTIYAPAWWKDAGVRAGRTALILGIPFFPTGMAIGEADWTTFALVVSLGAITSILTSLGGLPEAKGENATPIWRAILVRMVKSLAQGIATGIGTAVLLTDVDWSVAIQLGITGFVGSFILGLLSSLPETEGEDDVNILIYDADPGDHLDTIGADPDIEPVPLDGDEPLDPDNEVSDPVK